MLVPLKSDNNSRTLHEDVFKFMKISCWILLRMRKFSNKIVEKVKIHILRSATFSENRDVYELMAKNLVEPERPQITICRKQKEKNFYYCHTVHHKSHTSDRTRARAVTGRRPTDCPVTRHFVIRKRELSSVDWKWALDSFPNAGSTY